MYIVLVFIDGAPLHISEWSIDQSYEAEFASLDEASMYVRSLERWSAADSHDPLWETHKPYFKVYCEELGEYVC